MIKISKLTKNFDQTPVVKGVSLTIKPGEIIGLLGPNGAGKTTTIRMIAGVLPPSKGKITINGMSYTDKGEELKQQIGYLPENNPIYDELTVEEHLHFWAKVKSIPESKINNSIKFAVSRTGIADVYYRFIGELSKGYRQRVGLAQAILSKPEILLLDEPTEGLDPNQRKDIQKLLSELKKDRTVIVSSHVLSEISQLANRIVIIHQGQVVGDDSPSNLVKQTGGKTIIETEIKGNKVTKTLSQIDGIESVESLGKQKYILTTIGKKDIRPLIFKTAVKNNWVILEMHTRARQLEDVFSELTLEK